MNLRVWRSYTCSSYGKVPQAQLKHGKALPYKEFLLSKSATSIINLQTSGERVVMGMLKGFLRGSEATFHRITTVSFQLLFYRLLISVTQLFMIPFG